ncbi:MAG: GDSL-type esterase/lipase family protein [Christensenellales bacterium]|jgi:lysophospholipase L1-like esterase
MALFQNNDRILFVGGPLTHGTHFVEYIYDYYLTRYPNRRLRMTYAGDSSDTTESAIERMHDDLQDFAPRAAVLMLGLNDMQPWRYLKSKPQVFERHARVRAHTVFEERLRYLCQGLIRRQVVPLLVKPAPGAPMAFSAPRPGFVEAMGQAADTVGRTAAAMGLEMIDLYSPLLEAARREAQLLEPAGLYQADGLHTAELGDLVMAASFISQQQTLEPAAYLAISGRSVRSKGVRLQQLQTDKSHLSMIYEPNCLPFPLVSRYFDAQLLCPISEFLNRQILAVDLEEGVYLMAMDAKPCGRYTSRQLKKGVNLAVARSSPLQEAAQALAAEVAQWTAIQQQLRTQRAIDSLPAKVGKRPAPEQTLSRAQIEALQARAEALAAGFYQHNAPSPCRITLQRVG